jgi:hypothetical protein
MSVIHTHPLYIKDTRSIIKDRVEDVPSTLTRAIIGNNSDVVRPLPRNCSFTIADTNKELHPHHNKSLTRGLHQIQNIARSLVFRADLRFGL